jgi:hypothetical protein
MEDNAVPQWALITGLPHRSLNAPYGIDARVDLVHWTVH